VWLVLGSSWGNSALSIEVMLLPAVVCLGSGSSPGLLSAGIAEPWSGTRAAGDSVVPDDGLVQRPFLAQKKNPRGRIALFPLPAKSNQSGLYWGLLCRFLGRPV